MNLLGHACVELRLGIVHKLFRTHHSWPVFDPSASVPRLERYSIGGGLELLGVGKCDGAGVVPGGQQWRALEVELYGISKSVSVAHRCRSAD